MSYNKSDPAWWNERFPFLRVTNNSVEPWLTEEDSWAESIPIGWRNSFFEDMCNELTNALGEHVDAFEIEQLKEKYGSMRLYWAWKGMHCPVREDEIPNRLDDTINAIIDKYTDISYHTCVRCGATATKYTKPWILPVCDKCAEYF